MEKNDNLRSRYGCRLLLKKDISGFSVERANIVYVCLRVIKCKEDFTSKPYFLSVSTLSVCNNVFDL